ncbi:Predicted dehydrogenases and related proteins [Alteromonadaceae bacterium Bs31]|nr:Predicted dehydrogenases and related proteins [Alteromonadaceae bacterium Bs31]
MLYLIGAGYMASEYAKVLSAMDMEFQIVGRSEVRVAGLSNDYGVAGYSGGVESFVQKNSNFDDDSAIVCTPCETLSDITLQLLNAGFKKILLEKPGALSIHDLEKIKSNSEVNNALVQIGYNRRFYQATIELRNRLKNEELIAANFEITEWAHIVEKEVCASEVKQKWVYSNTSHVIDLVQYIAGSFVDLSVYNSGSLSWHSSSSRFVGAGKTQCGVLVSYCGYWDGPGRWSAEFVTTENRYILRPMEKLQVQQKGSVAIQPCQDVNYQLDEKFKPGIYMQVESFLGAGEGLCSIASQIASFRTFSKIARY